MTGRRSQLIFTTLVTALSLGAGNLHAQTREYEFKAAWLYQLGNTLIEWDERPSTEFVIGVFGDFPQDFEHQLGRVARHRIQNLPVRIKQYKTLNDFTQNSRPDILFISSKGAGATIRQRLQKALNTIDDHPVLIVGDTDTIDSGSAISFRVNQERRLVVRRNDAALEAYGLSLKNQDKWTRLIQQSSVEQVERVDPLIPTNSRNSTTQE